MTYRLAWSGPARRYFSRLDRKTKERVWRRLQEILADPRGRHSKRLKGADLWAARVGGWRIIFSVDDEEREVWVQVIAPRGQVYREL